MFAATTSPGLATDSRFVGWLALAVLAHALLLLIPSQRDRQSGEPLPALAISMLRAAPTAPAVPQANPRDRQTEPLRETPPGDPPDQPTADSTTAPNPPAERPTESLPRQPEPSAAYLLDLAGRQQWRLPETSAERRLGEHVPRPLPPNWRPTLGFEANRFDGMVAPAEIEVLDRWLAADGSQNIVVTTPDGQTYCGRAEAWNPLNPLVEPIMTYRSCGGGGKRTFDMPHPYRREVTAGERP